MNECEKKNEYCFWLKFSKKGVADGGTENLAGMCTQKDNMGNNEKSLE